METFTLEDRYLREAGTVHLTGLQALVRLLFDRVRHDRARGGDPAVFVSGYEGSPLAGYDLELGRRSTLLEKHDVVHRPGLNEELAATSVMGSQLVAGAGGRKAVTGFWYGKAPGLDRASDALRHANLAGTDPRGGAVALVGDDPNAKSSTVPCASELALADLAIPVLFPADAQDVLDLGMHAVELSRASGLWTSLKVVANVADASGTATVSPQWSVPGLDGGYRHTPTSRLLGASLAELERSLFTVRLPLALEYLRASGVNRITARGAADRIGIVSAGKSYLDLQQAMRVLGLDKHGIRVLKLGAIHPIEPTIVREFADGLDDIIVVEEKRAFVETALKEVLYGCANAPRIIGKKDHDGRTLFSELGELDPDGIAAGLARVLPAGIPSVDAYRGRRRRERIAVPLLARTPYFCSGCPHNSSTKVPEGTLVGGGIGCHTMALFMEPDQVGTVLGVTQMGGEGTQWIGMAPFVEAEHFVQNIGDGTFTHSGSLAVRAAVAAGVNITYKLLYNSAVAMTGGQDAVGGLPVEKVAELLLVEGAKRVVITSDAAAKHRKLPRGVEVRDRAEILRTQEELAAIKGVTVLIHEQECAAEKRRKRRRGKQTAPATRVVVNERVCEGCGDCGTKSNCLSVQPVDTEFGRKTAIHQSSCNVDYSCLAGDCPSFVTVVPSGRKRRRKTAELAADATPAPGFAEKDFTVRITGIGGTGVVTVTQILATAAVLDGRHVRTLDQTGLAQKGGAVVSDLKVTAEPVEQAPKLAAGECDLYLACDALVGADAANLGVADPARTTAVVSTTEVPTGRMVVDTTVSFPDAGSVLAPLEAAAARTVSLDARGLAEALFDDDQFANVLQLGAAFQTGAIPLPASVIERAIELNGTQVAANLQAFRHGRRLVAEPQAEGPAPATTKPHAMEALVHAEPGSELARLLDIRIPDLVAYQNKAYARAYAEFVERVRVLENGPTEITEAVAKHLYKLMAYKDEYEVARLSLDPAFTDGLEEQFGVGTQYAYRLHPPVLRALGMKRKIALGPWFRPAFRLLHALRRLRGTRFDPFGRAEVRQVERELVEDYRRVVLQALHAGDRGNARALAELPDLVRGYEDVKLANVARYRERQAEILTPAGS
ncbi:indolepyruvate ferredoxin oxidoreductase family protein [Amycolatopsis vancoresmycina]|uniref:Indolepyruvate ferredoxin oxidoreductase n=1 Tax=Amycolatopsis vancoresmycina DSM 44592 TaxID=1292037 RepID=R1HPW4_9PSEU|nr:indolepyruvate ferredoxin oxidoreductase family protein [Amycolatopsis vancoresmycina]EOD65545.1 indolepyruvate ferredoxin oxidoreductase [Amycolatopsis vancoresmycina DSM 44592]